jgi:hypothetical protein
MTISPGDRVYLRGTVTEIAAGMAGVRVDTGADDGPGWPLENRPVSVFLEAVVPAGAELPEYLSAADIADHFGVPANLVHTWRSRYGPDRSPEEIAKAPTCPQPAVVLGRRKPQAGYREDQLADWDAWRASLPGQGTGGGRPRNA